VEERTQRDTLREGGYMKMEVKTEFGSPKPRRAKGCWEPPESGRAVRSQFALGAFWETQPF
jgi:hypothetical protein